MSIEVNISALGELTPSEPLNLADYPNTTPAGSGGASKFALPPAGEYILRAPDAFPSEAFGKSQAGALTAKIDPVTVTGPTNDGYQIRFTNVSAKTFQRKEGDTVRSASLMADYVKACGISGTFPADPQEAANIVASTAGRTFRARLDWEAEDRKYGSGTKLKGMFRFPLNEDGTHQHYIELKDVLDDKGRPARVWANLRITSFVTA